MGELLWDVFPDRRMPGGAPANVAFHAKQLGLEAIVCSRVGEDDLGDQLLHHLESHGLDPRHVQRDPTRPTGTVAVDLGQADAPRYTFHEDAAWDRIAWTPELAELVSKSRVLCFGTLAQRSDVTRRTIWHALDSLPTGGVGVYDVNLRPPWYQKDWIHRSLELAAIAKYNEAESDVLARLFGLSGDSLEANARALLHRFGLEWVCVTRGAEGGIVVTPDEDVRTPGHATRATSGADPVGAGDAFTAALVRAYLDEWPPDAACELANRAGSLVAARSGAMPDVHEEMIAERSEIARRYGLAD